MNMNEEEKKHQNYQENVTNNQGENEWKLQKK